MAFNPEHFLTVARAIASSSTGEGSLRTAVGRAYYAMFLTAREKLTIRSRKKKVHAMVITALKREHRSVAEKLDELRRHRGIADYDLAATDWSSRWSTSSVLAEDLKRKLQRLRV